MGRRNLFQALKYKCTATTVTENSAVLNVVLYQLCPETVSTSLDSEASGIDQDTVEMYNVLRPIRCFFF